MMDRLYTQLHIWAATPHEWSYCDCFTVLGDWVQIVHGFDAAAELRGAYGNPEMCPIGRAYRADPIPLGDRLLDMFPVVQEASVGDVAFVLLPGERFMCGAIKLKGKAWAMKVKGKGILTARHVQPQKIWGLGYEA